MNPPVARDAAADPEPEPRRLGLLAGQITVPDDFDRLGEAEIVRLFEDGA